jgi:hypothetical protein
MHVAAALHAVVLGYELEQIDARRVVADPVHETRPDEAVMNVGRAVDAYDGDVGQAADNSNRIEIRCAGHAVRARQAAPVFENFPMRLRAEDRRRGAFAGCRRVFLHEASRCRVAAGVWFRSGQVHGRPFCPACAGVSSLSA